MEEGNTLPDPTPGTPGPGRAAWGARITSIACRRAVAGGPPEPDAGGLSQ